jgi:hypothetical protein
MHTKISALMTLLLTWSMGYFGIKHALLAFVQHMLFS